MRFRPLLWPVMDKAHGDPEALRTAIGDATAEQLTLLNRRLGIAAGELAASAAFQAHAEPGQAWPLASWVVTRGRKAWLDAMSDPRPLPKRAPPDAPDFARVLADAYRERFGLEIPEQEPDPGRDMDLRPDPVWEERVWEVIDLVNEGIPLEEVLSGFTRSELIKLNAALAEVTRRLQDEFRPRLGEDPEGLDWLRWAEWIVGQGHEAHERYRANPAELPRRVPDDAQLLADDIDEIYRNRYGVRFPWTPQEDGGSR